MMQLTNSMLMFNLTIYELKSSRHEIFPVEVYRPLSTLIP